MFWGVGFHFDYIVHTHEEPQGNAIHIPAADNVPRWWIFYVVERFRKQLFASVSRGNLNEYNWYQVTTDIFIKSNHSQPSHDAPLSIFWVVKLLKPAQHGFQGSVNNEQQPASCWPGNEGVHMLVYLQRLMCKPRLLIGYVNLSSHKEVNMALTFASVLHYLINWITVWSLHSTFAHLPDNSFGQTFFGYST